MNYPYEKITQEAAVFQRLWLETASRMMQAWSTFNPNATPPEAFRQARNGIFQALTETWEEYMRSPQFLEGSRQLMENVVTFRKLSNEFLSRLRNEMQVPSRGDIDTVMLTIRHMEQRLLDRTDALAEQLQAVAGKNQHRPARPRSPGARKTRPTTPRNGARQQKGTGI